MATKIITIKVIPSASANKITETDNILKVFVTAPKERNKANQAVIKLLAQFFNIKRSGVNIIKGEKSHIKICKLKL